MSETYPLTMPTVTGFQGLSQSYGTSVSVTVSPYSGYQQTQVYANQLHQFILELPPMKMAKARPWIAFLMALNGKEGTFYYKDIYTVTPAGTASTNEGAGPIQIHGGGQTGNTVVLEDLPISQADYLLAGDYIQIGVGTNSRLHRITRDINVSSGGLLTCPIWPSMRMSPTNNELVRVSNCEGLFRLDTNNPSWQVAPGDIVHFEGIPVKEAFLT